MKFVLGKNIFKRFFFHFFLSSSAGLFFRYSTNDVGSSNDSKNENNSVM